MDNCDNVQETDSDEPGTNLPNRLLVKLQPKGRHNIENIVQKLQKDNLSNRNLPGTQLRFEAVTSREGFIESDDVVPENSVILPEKVKHVMKQKGVSPRKKTVSKRKKVTPVKCRGKKTEMAEIPCLNISVTEDFTELNTDIKQENSNSADNLLVDSDGVQNKVIGEIMKVEPLSPGNTSLQGVSVEEEDISSREDTVMGSEVKSLTNVTSVNDNLVQTITNGFETFVDESNSENTLKVTEHTSKEKVTTIDTCDKNCELPIVANKSLPTRSKEFNSNGNDTDLSRNNRNSVSDSRSRVNIFEKTNCNFKSHIEPEEDYKKKNAPTVKNSNIQHSPVAISGSSDNRTERININKSTISLRNVPRTFGSRKSSNDEKSELTLNDLTSDELLSILETDTKVIRCDCSLIFTDEIMYFLHRNVHGRGGKLRCGFCDHEASDKYFFMIHQIHSHGCSGNPN